MRIVHIGEVTSGRIIGVRGQKIETPTGGDFGNRPGDDGEPGAGETLGGKGGAGGDPGKEGNDGDGGGGESAGYAGDPGAAGPIF